MAELEVEILDGPDRGRRVIDADPPDDSPTGVVPVFVFVFGQEVSPVYETDAVPDDVPIHESYELPASSRVYELVDGGRAIPTYRFVAGPPA